MQTVLTFLPQQCRWLFSAFPAQAAANAIYAQPLSLWTLSFSMLTWPGAQSQAVRLQLTLPEKPPLTKALSLLHCINSRVNKITYPQPNETGAVVAGLTCWPHPSPTHILLLPWDQHQPWLTPEELLCRGQGSGNLDPALPGSARHACNLIKSLQPLPAMSLQTSPLQAGIQQLSPSQCT